MIIATLLLITLLFPHSTSTSALAQPTTSAFQQDRLGHPRPVLEHAKNLIETHQEGAAIVTLKKFLASSPGPDDLDDAYLLMAAALISKKEYEDGIGYLNQLLSELPDSELTSRARLMRGAAQIAMGNSDAALSTLSEIRGLAAEPETKRQALKLIGDIHAQKADFFRAIQAWLEEASLSPPDQQADSRERIRELVLSKLDKKALIRLRDSYPTTFPGDLALIRLIETQTAEGEESLAERNIRVFLNRFPNHEYASTATSLLRTFQTKLKTSQQIIVAVLPLSGRLQPFGMESLNGIQLALEKGKDGLGVAIGLKVVDSETDKTALRLELTEVLAEYRPVAVIGPLLSRDLHMSAELAGQTGIPFITPSATVSEVRRFGHYLFSTAMTYGMQAQRLADHAISNMGLRRFCILYPETSYGQELAQLFSMEVRKRGGELIAVESFKETDTDFGHQIRRIKEADLKRYGQSNTTKTSKGAVRVTYTPGFDAIFVPADSSRVALIAPQLAFYDVKVPLLGSNTWNAPGLLQLTDHWIEGSTFVDGFFKDSPDQNVREFVDRYLRRYQSDPTLFAAQAYDATQVVLEAIRKGAASSQGVYERLLTLQNLPTLTGPASFGPGGALNRRLFIISVKNGKLVQLN